MSGTVTPPKPARQKSEALGGKVGRGMSWMASATLIVKILSFASTIVLGRLLSEDDYGVYGMAMGLSAFAQVLRDGGMRRILIQKQAHRYAGLSGPMYWFSGSFNMAAGVLLGAAAFPLAWLYDEPELAGVLLATAVSIPLTTAMGVYRAKMAVDLQFRQLAAMNTYGAVVRYASMILFAMLGFGALSFTLPLVAMSIFEGAYGYWATRDSPWRRSPRFRLWPALWSKAKWIVLGTLAMATLRQGDYFVFGLLKARQWLSTGAVGQYVFAFQIAVQINVLVAVNLQAVLFPALTKLVHEPMRYVQAVLRATRVMMLVGSVFGLGLACVMSPLESLLWDGKWAESVGAVMWMAAFFPMRLLTSVLNSAQMSRGRFKEWFWLTLLQGVGMMGAAAIAGLLFNHAEQLSLIIGLYFLVGVTPTCLWGMARCGVPWKQSLLAVTPAWLVVCAAGGLTLILAHLVEPISMGHVRWVDLSFEVMLRGVTFSVLAVIGLRVFARRSLAETVEVAPARTRRMVRKILRLPAPGRGAATAVSQSEAVVAAEDVREES